MRVTHVLGSAEREAGGIARTVINLAASLDASRYRLSAIVLGNDGPLGDTLRDLNVEVDAISWQGGRTDLAGALRFARMLRTRAPHIVHLHAGGLSSRFVARVGAGARVIAHFHSLREETPTRRQKRRSSLAADLVIVNSQATAASITGRRVLVVYPGVAIPTAARQHATRAVVVGVAARLSPVKGVGFLIEALRTLRETWPGMRLEIAGDGPDRASLEKACAESGLAGMVRFLGWVSEVNEPMRGWDIYAQPSLAEGFGIAALEAMAHGIPVVASDVGGLSEAIANGETGFLVAPCDSRMLATRIAGLAGDPTLRSRMGAAARRRVAEHFSLEQEAATLLKAYESLLS
ncbi:MAG: glycosyltransferase family 4 protein [Gemmatimonadaceae bacterium]